MLYDLYLHKHTVKHNITFIIKIEKRIECYIYTSPEKGNLGFTIWEDDSPFSTVEEIKGC